MTLDNNSLKEITECISSAIGKQLKARKDHVEKGK